MQDTSREQKILFCCYVIIIPVLALVYRLWDLRNHFGTLKSTNSALLSLFFNFFLFTILLIMLKMLSQIWKETHDKYEMKLSEDTRDILIQQEKKVRELKEEMNERQFIIYEMLDKAKACGKQENFEQMRKMITDLSAQMEKNKVENFCHNSLLNTILQVKKAEAEKQNIQCDFRIILPNRFETFFSDTTITSLFCNLLDNAIESCKNVKRKDSLQNLSIILSVNYQANMLIISQKNSKSPEVLFDHKTSKKYQKELHGVGLYTIEDIVKKYDGIAEWKDEGEIFVSNLMLKLERV